MYICVLFFKGYDVVKDKQNMDHFAYPSRPRHKTTFKTPPSDLRAPSSDLLAPSSAVLNQTILTEIRIEISRG
ncbi:hypothetical protein NPIL_401491 [Nephila pilipes]|uniref:Uncharacterized protein n=1 Tax=Nephila pilipes TaxID=299642 RepID=A0A8X6PX59_NEPPI|nr:hypothetical protein NPIL_401491 [Nephila pilipes]